MTVTKDNPVDVVRRASSKSDDMLMPDDTIGGSSLVRRCIEKKTGKEFAVKIVDISGAFTSEEDKQLLYSSTVQEINIIKKVSPHPNIIEIHDSFITNSFIFLVLELCKTELYDILGQEVTLSEKKTKFILRQVLIALEHMHKLKIVHRDIKPENILVSDNKLSIKLTDLGFSVYVENDQTLHDLCGTPAYLAPEILECRMYTNAKGYGRPVDIWSSGVLMYSLLIGTTPFWHKKQIYMFRAIKDKEFTFEDRPECADISDLAKDLMTNMLIKDPDKRFTAHQALQHSFFFIHERAKEFLRMLIKEHPSFISAVKLRAHQLIEAPIPTKFQARQMFKKSILVVLTIANLRSMRAAKLKGLELLVTAELLRDDPYKVKPVHKYIDAMAFHIYGHWIKKGTLQNRALLFETNPKTELKQISLKGCENIADLFPKY